MPRHKNRGEIPSFKEAVILLLTVGLILTGIYTLVTYADTERVERNKQHCEEFGGHVIEDVYGLGCVGATKVKEVN